MLRTILEAILVLINVAILPVALWVFFCDYYNFILSFWGFKKPKRDYEIIEDKTKFLILVAAHNEENVLESSYDNWKKIDYNPDLYRIIVVNDNSTDTTKTICEEIGVDHVNTIEGKFQREGVGKPAGIQYALRELGFEYIMENFDLVMVLDADNHVDSNILKETNSQYQKYKPTAIQTYLGSKNPNSSIIARGYATVYWSINRFFQLAKYRLGLFNAIGGTGFAVSSQWLLSSGGFKYKSLTEDLEMEIKIVQSGGSILWNHFAGIYDEKPDELKVSIRQRIRWSQGHWFVAFDNLKNLLVCIRKDKRNTIKYLDQIIYLFSMGRGIMVALLLIQYWGFLILSNIMLETGSSSFPILLLTLNFLVQILVPITIFRIFLCIYSYIFTTSFAIYIDGDKKNYAQSVLAILYIGITYMYTHVIGLIKWKQQGVWVKTPHKYTTKTTQHVQHDHQNIPFE